MSTAFMAIYDGRYKDAVASFKECLSKASTNPVLVNNWAVAELFCINPSRATKLLLESIVTATNPLLKSDISLITEPSYLNLMSLYEITTIVPKDRKSINKILQDLKNRTKEAVGDLFNRVMTKL